MRRSSRFAASVVSTLFFFFFQAEDGIRDYKVTGVQTCALPILPSWRDDVIHGIRRERRGNDAATHSPYRAGNRAEHEPRIARREPGKVDAALDNLARPEVQAGDCGEG